MGGISTLLSVVALLGFLLLLAGIGLVVVAASQGRPVRSGLLLAVLGLIAGLLFSVVSNGILIVEPTQVAVVVNTLTGTLDTPARGPGTSVIVPLVQQYYVYPTTQVTYTMSGTETDNQTRGNDAVAARSVDGQEVSLDVSVIYAINAANVNDLHVRWQTGYQDNFIRPTVRGLVRDVVSGYPAEEIYGAGRTDMENSIEDRIRIRLEEEGLILSDLLVRDISFSEQFRQAIENKQIADQEAQRAQLQVRQRENEANQARAVAAGERDAEIARAEGQAQATILQAQAEAEALRLVNEQIASNPSLIQYVYVKNLSDNVSIALVPSNSPFLFDFDSLAEANTGFVPPDAPDSNSTPTTTSEEAVTSESP
ncbi:MAG: prohibitin family protein [Anaerolineae bacterium]|nr:prohibitin family protein [Anaerolineae bacterium]